MSAEDKVKHAAEKLVGKAKEVAGDATGNDRLAAEGRAEQTKGRLGDAVENVKDAFKK